MNFESIISAIFEAPGQKEAVSSVDMGDLNDVDLEPKQSVVEPFSGSSNISEPDTEADRDKISRNLEALKNIRLANINNNLGDLAVSARQNIQKYIRGVVKKSDVKQSLNKVATVANAIDKVVDTSDLETVPKRAAKKVLNQGDNWYSDDEMYDKDLKDEMDSVGHDLRKKDMRNLADKARKYDELHKNDGGIPDFNPPDKDPSEIEDSDDAQSVTTADLSPEPKETAEETKRRTADDKIREWFKRGNNEDDPVDTKPGVMHKLKRGMNKMLRKEDIDKDFEEVVFGDI